jgi:hypothetical protein
MSMRNDPYAKSMRGRTRAAFEAVSASEKHLGAVKAVINVLAPDEPLGPLFDELPIELRRKKSPNIDWPPCVQALRERYPGYQPGPRYREDMKYRRAWKVPDDAPLLTWATILLNHAKAKWSRDLEATWTNLQFAEWLPFYVTSDEYPWRGGKLDDAAGFLRALYGIAAVRQF